MDDKQKLSDFLLMKLQECKLKPHDGAIYGEAADYIAEQLIATGYRKQSDVVSEFVQKLKKEAFKNCKTVNCYEFKFIETKIYELAAEFGAEVEE